MDMHALELAWRQCRGNLSAHLAARHALIADLESDLYNAIATVLVPDLRECTKNDYEVHVETITAMLEQEIRHTTSTLAKCKRLAQIVRGFQTSTDEVLSETTPYNATGPSAVEKQLETSAERDALQTSQIGIAQESSLVKVPSVSEESRAINDENKQGDQQDSTLFSPSRGTPASSFSAASRAGFSPIITGGKDGFSSISKQDRLLATTASFLAKQFDKVSSPRFERNDQQPTEASSMEASSGAIVAEEFGQQQAKKKYRFGRESSSPVAAGAEFEKINM